MRASRKPWAVRGDHGVAMITVVLGIMVIFGAVMVWRVRP